MPYKVEQISDYLFPDTYKSNKTKIAMNEMRVKDSEMIRDETTTLSQKQIPALR